MDFLTNALGVKVKYGTSDLQQLPSYLLGRYRVREVLIDGRKTTFVYPKTELEPVDALVKHLNRIEKETDTRAVLVPDYLTYRQKESFVRENIPFIVERKQIYLPFLAVYLQERCAGERREMANFLPSSQLLMLYYIYKGGGELQTSDAVKDLGFTPTSISRASKQLEELGLFKTEKRGVQKVIFSEMSPRDLFEKTEVLLNPVKRTVYVEKNKIKKEMLISGESALAEYSMLNPPKVECYGAFGASDYEAISSSRLNDSKRECAVEIWRYDPRKLADGQCVDRLSLALSLRESADERVEMAVEEMLDKVWEEIDGKGNRKV